ncbi:hypothetical protein ACGFJC_47570 [Nonomuraea fuscirosea]|uniref:hypothetical protein n=1 Tax=Nonomuraea fuscirosea TaxID=1291556 RepID=UPI003723F366
MSAAGGMDIDDDTGERMAAALEREYGYMAMVLWEVAGRHFTAFWRGHVPVGVYVKGRTPQELRTAIAVRLSEVRLAVEAGHLPHAASGFPTPPSGRRAG